MLTAELFKKQEQQEISTLSGNRMLGESKLVGIN